MSLRKDADPVCLICSCGCERAMKAMAYAVWDVRTQSGIWSDYYITAEDRARGAAS